MTDQVKKAAILLLAMGKETAAEVLRHMTPKEVRKVSQAMIELKLVSRGEVQEVMSEFMDTVEQYTGLGANTDEYIRAMLVGGLGEEKANNILDRIPLGETVRGLETLRWMDPRAICELIRHEHPQIIAIVLSCLDEEQAAEVLQLLPENTRSEIVLRLATLDGVQPAAIRELNDIIERRFIAQNNVRQSNIGGVKAAASILNCLDITTESQILEAIREKDEQLGRNIEDLMFVFGNLIDMDDRSLQTLLREVSMDTLVLALKSVDEDLREKFYSNMSRRASEMLREDIEARGPVRLSEVEAAQKEILSIARRMADAGDLVLQGKGVDDFV